MLHANAFKTGRIHPTKHLIFVAVCCLFCLFGHAQCKEFMIGMKGDTLNCIDMKGQKQGKWVNRLEELRGEPGFEEEGEYRNDKKEGPWKLFTLQGDLMGIENYRWGNKSGVQQYFNSMGDIIREESWLASNPDKPTETVEVFDVNDPSKVYRVEVKMEGSSVPHGIWKIYEPGSGRLLKKENFILGKLDDGSGTGNGLIQKDEAPSEEPASGEKKPAKKETPKPKQVSEFEKKNEGKKKIKIRTGETGG